MKLSSESINNEVAPFSDGPKFAVSAKLFEPGAALLS